MCQNCELIKKEVQDWRDKQGHDKCWYYPEIFEKIISILNLENIANTLPTEPEFERGCEKYRREIYS